MTETRTVVIPDVWSADKLTPDQRMAVESLTKALDGYPDPWQLIDAAHATLRHDDELLDLVLIEAVVMGMREVYAGLVELLDLNDQPIHAWVRLDLLTNPVFGKPATLIARRVQVNTDSSIRIELFSPTDQYTVDICPHSIIGGLGNV